MAKAKAKDKANAARLSSVTFSPEIIYASRWRWLVTETVRGPHDTGILSQGVGNQALVF